MKASDNEFPYVTFAEQGSAPATPGSGLWKAYMAADGMHVVDDAGADTGPFAESVGGGSSFTGYQVLWQPTVPPGGSGTSTDATADRGFIWPVTLAGPMKVRSLLVDVATSATGQIQWGLYDPSASATAMTQLVAGSAATGGTGWRALAATSAPVAVDPGAYFLILKMPASNVPTLRRTTITGTSKIAKSVTPYTWDTTPDATSAWTDSGNWYNVALLGDIDGSNQW